MGPRNVWGGEVGGNAFQAIQARLELFERSGNPLCLLERQALEEATALRRQVGWPAYGPLPPRAQIERELDAIVLAGRFSWARAHELPGVDRLDALLEATELFCAAYPSAPGSVPAQAAGVCAAISSSGGVDPAALHNDALDVLEDALARRDLKTADQAIWHIAAAILAARGDHAEPFFLTSLGSAWLGRFEITGRIADINNAITAHRRAVAVPAPTWEEAGRQANYSAALLKRFEQCADPTDLTDALAAGRAAVDLVRQARADLNAGIIDSSRAGAVRHALYASLSSLSAASLTSFEYRRARPDLDEAIQASREAVDATAEDDPSLAARQANLAHALLERFPRFWQVADLEEALQAAAAAADAVPAGGLAEGACLSALALANANRFAYTGELRNLDIAISTGRRAVNAALDGHPNQAGCLSNLGGALLRRYEAVGDTKALDEAITMHRRAVQATAAGSRRPGYLNNLGDALRRGFAVTDNMADIKESITVLREAVATVGRDATDRAGYVADLALSLVAAAEHSGTSTAVDEAIAVLEREAGTIGDDHPLRSIYFAAFGDAWRAQFEATSEDNALRNAIAWFEKAADALPGEHPRRAENLTSQGAALLTLFQRDGDARTGRRALIASQSAAGLMTAPAFTRALAARNWGQAAASLGDAQEAVTGFALAVNLLDEVAWRGLRRRDQERRLTRFAALACDAAAWAIEAGQPQRAIEILEQGRGVLLAQSLHQRARHHDLVETAPDLAARMETIDQALEQLASADTVGVSEGNQARRAELTSQRHTLLRQIRQLPGFADFLRPPEFASLQQAAAQGPVVITNVSRYRCDALTITTSGVTVTTLTGLSGEDVARRAGAFVDALQHLSSQPAEETITATLAWLWDTIAAPLLHDLRLDAVGQDEPGRQRPRMWWCPTGPLTFMPLHAAGRHDTPGQAVIDLFTSSYAPTLRLLQQAHQYIAPTASGGKPLLVALPFTPGQLDLPDAAKEADAFAERFSKAIQIRGPSATVAATKKALENCPPWAHFACHGLQDISDPSAGHLALHDGPLPIGEISGMRLQQTELAFLSACETFRGGAALADEAITLATAFRLAGYRHVIGTLWSISDELAPGAADQVYETLARPDGLGIDADKTAAALDTAVLTLREECPNEPWLWAPYVHIGP
jgi:hypothetical protein